MKNTCVKSNTRLYLYSSATTTKGTMKMNITIELDDEWIEEQSISEAMEESIKRSIVFSLTEKNKQRTEVAITNAVDEAIESKLNAVIDEVISQAVDNGRIMRNRQEISIVRYIETLFMESSGWGSPNKKIEAVAKKFGEDLKIQYNNIFAAKIVENMKKQGFLKDDVASLLLENNG